MHIICRVSLKQLKIVSSVLNYLCWLLHANVDFAVPLVSPEPVVNELPCTLGFASIPNGYYPSSC